MAETTNLNIRIDRDLKNEADQIFTALGMNLTTAITVFVKQAVRQRKCKSADYSESCICCWIKRA